jgi:hypothetical protein
VKVLVLHPEDAFEDFAAACHWDLVVDLGHAPASSYQLWGRVADCRVISLYHFGREAEDLYFTRALLQAGMRQMVDRFGVDWWDVLSLMFAADLQDIMLASRLAKELSPSAEIFASRPAPTVNVLQAVLGRTIASLDSGAGPVSRRLRRYCSALRRLDGGQLAQVLQDKFDREHTIRRRLARRVETSEQPVVLLPSAYINVSRTAVAYASMVPGQQFLLALTRKSAKLAPLPPNISSRSLDGYFTPTNPEEINSLLGSWTRLKAHLVTTAAEFAVADKARGLERMPGLLRWGVAVRNAWLHLFESENIVGCLCADDSNPYSRIPLILAEQKSIPTVACHHGALDARMAMKTRHGNFYLAKGEMEKDFLVRVCRVAQDKVVIGAPPPGQKAPKPASVASTERQWLVFFTEPYQTAAWRPAEIYRDLLPRLVSLARTCGLKLVFKVHPFESVKGLRQMLRKYLSKEDERRVGVIGGPTTPEVWQNLRFAMTVQSTVALECATRGIPVFLCAWLGDPYIGYINQFARFGLGQVLHSPEAVAQVPALLEATEFRHPVSAAVWQTLSPEKLQALLSGTYATDSPLKIEAVS